MFAVGLSSVLCPVLASGPQVLLECGWLSMRQRSAELDVRRLGPRLRAPGAHGNRREYGGRRGNGAPFGPRVSSRENRSPPAGAAAASAAVRRHGALRMPG